MPELHGLKLRLGPRRWPDPWTDVPAREPALTPPSREKELHPSRNKAGSQCEGPGFWGRARGTCGHHRPAKGVPRGPRVPQPEGQEVGECSAATVRAPPGENPGPGPRAPASRRRCTPGTGVGAGPHEARGFPAPGTRAGKSTVTAAGGSPPDTGVSDRLPKDGHLLCPSQPWGKGWESCRSQGKISGVPPCCRCLNPSAFAGQVRWHCEALALVQDVVPRSQHPAYWRWAGPCGPLLLGSGATLPGAELLLDGLC